MSRQSERFVQKKPVHGPLPADGFFGIIAR